MIKKLGMGMFCICTLCLLGGPLFAEDSREKDFQDLFSRADAALDISWLDENYRRFSFNVQTTFGTDRYLAILAFPIAVHDKYNDANLIPFANLSTLALGLGARIYYEKTESLLAHKILLGVIALINGSHHVFLTKPRYENEDTLSGLKSVSIFVKNESDYFPFSERKWGHISPGFGVGFHLSYFHVLFGYNYNIDWIDNRRTCNPHVYVSVDAFSWLLRLMARGHEPDDRDAS